jgi:methionine-rich copper-binding protein CopC
MKRVALGVLLVASLLACGGNGVTPQNNPNGNADTTAPTLVSSTPVNTALNVAVNTKIKLVFNEKMDTLSVNVSSDPNNDLGSAAWNAAGTEASFIPPANLETSSEYTLNIVGTDVAGNALAETVLKFTTAGDSNPPPLLDTTAPSIASSSPENGSNNVAINAKISVSFSEAMNPNSIALSVNPSVNLGTAIFKPENNSVEFDPLADLSGDTNYTVNVSAKDLAGNNLTGSSSFTFKTATTQDSTAPTVPQNLAAEAGESQIRLTWDANTETDLKGYTIYYGDTANNLASSVFVDKPNTSKTLTGLSNGTTYFFQLEAEDAAGNRSGRTGSKNATPRDLTAPRFLRSSPENGSTNAAINSNIAITFSEAMNPNSVSVSLNPSVNLGAASFKSGNSVVEFNPPADLAGNTNYTVTLNGQDLAGNNLTGSSSFSFKTATIQDTNPPGIPQNVVAEAGDSQIKLTWNANTEPDLKGYTIYYSNNASNLNLSVFVAKPNTSKTLTGLSNGQIYFYQLEAEDSAGNRSGRTITKNATPKDPLPPQLLSSVPANGATNVAANSKVVFNFSEAMNPDKSKPRRPCVPLAGRADAYCGVLDSAIWDNGGKRLTLTYAANLIGTAVEPTYVFETAEDKAGNPLPLTQIKFSLADDPAPTLVSYSPTNRQANVPRSSSVRLTFSKPMNTASVQSRFIIGYDGSFIPGRFTWENNDSIMSFKPNEELRPGAQVSWLLNGGARDRGGILIDGSYGASFITINNVSTVVILPSFGNGHILATCNRGETICALTSYLNESVLRVGDRASSGAEFSRVFLSFPIYQIPAGARITQAQLSLSYAGGSGQPFQRLGNLVLERINISQIVEQGYKLPTSAFSLTSLPALGCVGCPFFIPNAQIDLNVATAVTADRNEGHALTQFRLRFATNSNLDGNSDFIDFAKNAKLTVAYETP